MNYRAEIDGLRSLAIIPVVGFHAGITAFAGGFTGVDTFFVISGFLITGIILSELTAGPDGGFSVLTFYKRRMLRILPALSVMLAATALAAFLLMLPNEFVAIGRSIIATALFVSNIDFWLQSGYFARAVDVKPLLHTWSLAVEEQFYLFFPVFLIIVTRWLARRFLFWIGLMVLASFALAVFATPRSPAASFFLLPTRIWELGLGALVAAGGAPRLASARNREIVAWVGVGLLSWGAFMLTEDDPFPGWNALYPCLGAGLIIAYAAGSSVGRILSLAPIVYIGRISYSLYLWHWPVIVFHRTVYGHDLSPRASGAVILISFALAALSYHFVETPFRSASFRVMPARRVLRAGFASILVCLVAGAAISRTGGAWRSYPSEVLRIAAYSEYFGTAEHRYQFGGGENCASWGYRGNNAYERELCLVPDPSRPNYLLIGDSHADALWRAITLSYPGIHFLKATMWGCRPLLDADGQAPCRETDNSVYRDFLPSHHLDGLILAGRWWESDLPKVAQTLEYLKKYTGNIVLLGPTVEYFGDFPLLLAQEKLTGNDGITEDAIKPDKKSVSDQLGRIAAAERVTYVPIYDAMCPANVCTEMTPEGVPLQFDYGHLTLEGSKLVIARVRDQMHLDEGRSAGPGARLDIPPH